MNKPANRPKYTLSFRPMYDGADDRDVQQAIRWMIKRAGRTFHLKFVEVDVQKTEDEIKPGEQP